MTPADVEKSTSTNELIGRKRMLNSKEIKSTGSGNGGIACMCELAALLRHEL